MRRTSSRIWAGRIVAAVALVGLVSYLSVVGLDQADKVASVLGLLVAVIALVAPYLLPSGQPSSAGPPSRTGSESAQSVTNTVVGGNLTQARDVHSSRVLDTAAPGPQPTAAAENGPVPRMPSGQYVNGVWVAGNLTQIDGADGDVTLG